MLSSIFKTILTLSIMGSVLTLMILLVKTLFGRRFSARWHYLVWGLLLLRLIIPYAPGHSFSIFNLFKPVVSMTSGHGSGHEGVFTGAIPVTLAPSPAMEPMVITVIPGSELVDTGAQFPLTEAVPILWVAGMAIMSMLIIGSNLILFLRLRKRPLGRDESALTILEACRRELGLKSKIPLVLDRRTGTPMLTGLFKPRIVMSHETLARLSQEEKRHVFLHELMHVKHRDILVNWILTVIRCIHWFNPVIWYACRRMKEDCEYACDERVLKSLESGEHKRYGQTILNLAAFRAQPIALTCTTGMAGKKSVIKRRIKMIAGFRKKTWVWTVLAVALTLLVGCSAMTGTEPPAPSQSADNSHEENKPPSEEGDELTEIGDNNSPVDEPEETAENTAPVPDDHGLVFVMSQDFQDTDVEKALKNGQTVVYDGDTVRAMGITSLESLKELQEEGILDISQADLEALENQSQETLPLGYFTSEDPAQIHDFVDRVVVYYMHKLPDQDYTGTYGHEYVWYTAAEELGKIGRPAIPYLIERIGTSDDYERTLILYALLLATQQDNVKAFTNGEYINVNLDFNASNHPAMVKSAMDWWEKYRDNF